MLNSFQLIRYPYTSTYDRYRARGLLTVMWVTALGLGVGLIIQLMFPVTDELIRIAGIPMGQGRIVYGLSCLLGIICFVLIVWCINRGWLLSANIVYLALIFSIAVLNHLPTQLTSGTLLLYSLPLTAAGVLLGRRGLIVTVVLILTTWVVLFDLDRQGVLAELSWAVLSPTQALAYGGLILIIGGTILNIFVSGQNLLLQQNFALMADLEQSNAALSQLIVAEQDEKQHLTSALTHYSAFVENVASGNLRNDLELPELDTSTEVKQLGSSLNSMVNNLRAMAGQIRAVSETIVSTAAEIQVAALQQTSTILEQDAAVNQTVATVEEVRQTVEQTAERAQAVASASQQSVVVSRDGQRAVADNSAGMERIRQQVEGIAQAILMLSERTQQIGQIIDAVNALADQSKLLALNASIEAARAGEEGRGFAVVAMEVRQLAEQSREATGRVRGILNEIQQTTNAAVMVTEQGSKGAAEGMALVERAGLTIRELAATLEDASQAATQIAASTHQQTNGMDQLVAAILQIKAASEQTAVGTRQTEMGIQNLIGIAEELEQAAARYRL